ncbi:MAG: hypothetical protein ICV75_07175 [Nitrospiraceae bacterium]|nr:hypothetical protein [Nitrospiraceae bacterium]
MEPEDVQEAGRPQALALAAAIAMLGMSVGVNVQALLAASPTEAVPSNQNKLGHEGIKRDTSRIQPDSLQHKRDSRQHKLPGMQDKRSGDRGVKPVVPA